MPSSDRPPLVFLIGPTAVGKTELSLRLAERLGFEIISADSRLFYTGMDIGTAKPNLSERQRVKHHLIDILPPDENFSLAAYVQAVSQVVNDLWQHGRVALAVGGTGQYVRSITEGWRIPTGQPDPRLRAVLEDQASQLGAGTIHRWLALLDPQAASRIDPRNVRRTVRALEVILSSGRRFSDQRRRGEPAFRTLVIGLSRPRSELFDRIDRRIEHMLAEGFIDEVRDLLDAGYSPNLPSMSAIGYREMGEVVAGKITLEEALAQMKRRTRAFVRRQANWFKQDDPSILWHAMTPDPLEHIVTQIQTFLEESAPG